MEKSFLRTKICLVVTVCAAVSLPTCVFAEQMKTVLTKVTSIGSQKQNTSARPVNARGVEVIVIASGSRIEATKDGQIQPTATISQIALALPARNADLSTLQSLCLDRMKALQAGTNGRQALEFTFDGSRIGKGSYLASSILGCADVTSTAAVTKPKSSSNSGTSIDN